MENPPSPSETLIRTSPELLGEEAIAKVWDAFGDFQKKGIEQLQRLNNNMQLANQSVREILDVPDRAVYALIHRAGQLTKRAVHNIENLMHESVTTIQPGEEVETEISIEALRKLPKAERPEALRILKEKHKQNIIGLAMIQADATKRIRANPDISREELYSEIISAGEKIGMSDLQRRIAKKAVEKYCNKHEAVKKYREKYPEDLDLFIALTNRPPVGKIEIITGPMTFMIRCHHIDDYALIVDDVFLQDSKVETKPSKRALRSGGISTSSARQSELEGTIIGEKVSWSPLGKYSKDSMALLEHEQQHAFHAILETSFQEVSDEFHLTENIRRINAEQENVSNQYEKKYILPDKEAALKIFSYTLIAERYFGEFRARNEILAYTIEKRWSPFAIQSILFKPEIEGGLYDYFARLRIPEAVKKHKIPPEVMEEMKDRYITKPYQVHVIQGIKAVEQLKNKGYTEEGIIGLFTNIPLDTWPKEVKRVLERV